MDITVNFAQYDFLYDVIQKLENRYHLRSESFDLVDCVSSPLANAFGINGKLIWLKLKSGLTKNTELISLSWIKCVLLLKIKKPVLIYLKITRWNCLYLFCADYCMRCTASLFTTKTFAHWLQTKFQINLFCKVCGY